MIQGYRPIEFLSPIETSDNAKRLGLGIKSEAGVLRWVYKLLLKFSSWTDINYDEMHCDSSVYKLEKLKVLI